MIKRILWLTGILMLTLASCQKGPQFRVKGTIANAADSMLYLDAITADSGLVVLDSIRLKADGTFDFSADAPSAPDFYSLRINQHRMNFAIDSTETLTFRADLTHIDSMYHVDGSDDARRIRDIDLQWRRLQRHIVDLAGNWDLFPGDIVDSIANLEAEYKELMKAEYIFDRPQSTSAYYAVCQTITDTDGTHTLFNANADRTDAKCYATVATAWDAAYPDSRRTQLISQVAIEGMKQTAPKERKELHIDESKISVISILDFSLPDISGRTHSISELKGKVVLLDFTSYAHKQSATRIRSLRTLYEQYHAQGFEIVQISVDADEHFWKYAAENLPWLCLRDTNGKVAEMYAVRDIPTFFLIDRDNALVKRNDSISDLDAEIQALL